MYPAIDTLEKGGLDSITKSIYVKIDKELPILENLEPFKENFEDYSLQDPLLEDRKSEVQLRFYQSVIKSTLSCNCLNFFSIEKLVMLL